MSWLETSQIRSRDRQATYSRLCYNQVLRVTASAMALQKVGSKAIQVKKACDEEVKKLGVAKPTKIVLDEESYTEDLEKIIERDYFPDLAKLQAQNEYLDAVERKDTDKIRELLHKFHQKKHGKRPPTRPPTIYSPTTFETPDIDFRRPSPTSGSGADDVHRGQDSSDEEFTANPEPPKEEELAAKRRELSLDHYMVAHTSEDNASFDQILKEGEEKHRQKHAWLYEQEEEKGKQQSDRLALPSIEQQALGEPVNAMVDTWSYQAKNTVMYNPEGVSQTFKERLEKRKGRLIEKRNTRFIETPFNSEKNQKTISDAAGSQALAQHGKIGVDGKEVLAPKTPMVGGHGFVATPSPAPGVNESPLMTWGEIEGTPFRLDGSSTPGQTPVFKMPNIPRRDELAHELAEQASKQHRAKKKQALEKVSRNIHTPSPKFGSSPMDRLRSMSPAARRLASSKFAVRTHTDKALRDSYTPSPSRDHDNTPTPISRRTPTRSTPTRSTPTPGGSRQAACAAGTTGHKRPASGLVASEGLTDNLLQLPSKSKRDAAADYF